AGGVQGEQDVPQLSLLVSSAQFSPHAWVPGAQASSSKPPPSRAPSQDRPKITASALVAAVHQNSTRMVREEYTQTRNDVLGSSELAEVRNRAGPRRGWGSLAE
ncbi:MAG: hypothetical protein H6Q90_6000, partial [Deltaproteobacteria bacterium]|nr:hypothetical protein [Deltaproteobacteria bacterium]